MGKQFMNQYKAMYIFQKFDGTNYNTVTYFYATNLEEAERLLNDLWNKHSASCIRYEELENKYSTLEWELKDKQSKELAHYKSILNFKKVTELQSKKTPNSWELMTKEESEFYFGYADKYYLTKPLKFHSSLTRDKWVRANLLDCRKIETDVHIFDTQVDGD